MHASFSAKLAGLGAIAAVAAAVAASPADASLIRPCSQTGSQIWEVTNTRTPQIAGDCMGRPESAVEVWFMAPGWFGEGIAVVSSSGTISLPVQFAPPGATETVIAYPQTGTRSNELEFTSP